MTQQRIDTDRGDWEVSVARHAGAPTFTFDVVAPAEHMTEMPPSRRVISCHNMTRADLEEHVRNCQAALAEEPVAAQQAGDNR